MELRNDNFNLIKKGVGLKFTGKGINDFYNNNNIYNSNGIGIQLINNQNNNREIAFVDTSNIDNNFYSKLKIGFNNSSINIRNLNENNELQTLNFNNNLIITNNVGIGSLYPKTLLDVSGRISCDDINIGGIVINKDYLINVSTTVDNVKSGILKIEYGGTGVSSLNNEQILFGKFQQSPNLVWLNDKKRLGIGISNPLYSVDVKGGVNSYSYKINGKDINDIFLKSNDLLISSNECYNNCSNASIIKANLYTDAVSLNLINKFNEKTSDWTTYGGDIIYINSRVGIGTNLPLTSLHVVGDINYTGNLRRNGLIFRSFSGDYNDLSNLPKITWELSNAHLYNLNNANVGIGISNPRSKLDVNGDINYTGNLRSNGNIINFFSGNYNDLSNLPSYSKVAYTGSYYDISEKPELFSGDYKDLKGLPTYFPTNWNTSISNIPIHFPTNWNTSISNIPTYFKSDWITTVKNKPLTFDTDWNSNVYGKPEYFYADWNTTVYNKPNTFYTDWNSNIINKPIFATVAFTGQYSNITNKPYIFTGYYKHLKKKPNFSSVAFNGYYSNLLNCPTLFSGDYNHLSNIPSYFPTDWNSTISNIPSFSTVATTGLYNDLINKPIETWGYNENYLFNCNISNVGIGITNPLFKLDVRGSVNLNNSLQLNKIEGIQEILKNKSPWGTYFAEDWSGTTLPDSSGNGRHATTTSTITKNKRSGYGATNEINYISGGTTDTISWPEGSISNNFTILSVTRYSGTSKGRILVSMTTGNWLHGHHNGNRGVCFYDGWKSPDTNIGVNTDWVCTIGKNGGSTPNNILVNGIGRGNATGGASNFRLGINNGLTSQTSDWELNCVLIWNIHLTDAEIFDLNSIIMNNLNNGGSTKALFNNEYKIFIYSDIYFSNQIFINNSNISNVYASSNDFIRTSNWVINGNNIYNVNSGSVGINTFNPSSSYKLDVNGAINSSGYNISGNGGIFWSSYGNAGIGCASVNGEYSSSSLIGDMVIKTNDENNKIILQNGTTGTLYVLNNKIGIGTNEPSSILHLHNPSNTGEVKILITDGSTGIGSSDGFSIFKSGNDDGNIWNYENSALCFGTNNVERMRILANGNIGIGITNPTSLLHLHNLSEEVKISLTDTSTGSGISDGFSIIKSQTGEGNIWNYENYALRFGTNNLERMCILANGNVGIGTNNPNSLLHLHNPNLLGEVKCLLTDGNTGITSADGFSIFKSGNDDGNIWNYENAPIRFGTNNIERMCILANGNIGIGTSDPNSIFHLYNSSTSEIKISLTDSSTGSGVNDGFSIYKSGTGEGNIWNYENSSLCFGTNNVERMCILANGNVGIGTTNPTSILHLHNPSNTGELKISLTDANTVSSGFSIFKDSSDNGNILNYSNKSIIFGTNGTERMRILENGNVGIGTNNPSSLLHLHKSSGELKILLTDGSTGTTSTSGFAIYKSNSTDINIWNYSSSAIRFATNNSERMCILANGNVGIGINNPDYNLHVNGTIKSTSFVGDGSNINNLNAENISLGILSVSRGGTGLSTLTSGQFLIGNGTNPIIQSTNLVWDNTNSFLGIGSSLPKYNLDVNGTIKANNFNGNGSLITNLNLENVSSGILSVSRGGTGLSTLALGQLLIGNGLNPLTQSANLVWDNTNSFLGIGSSIPRFNLDVNGTINVSQIYKNGTEFFGGSKWTNVSGTNNIYYNLGSIGINSSIPSDSYKLDVNGNVKINGSITANSFIGNASGLTGNPSISVSGIDLNITGNISRVNNITANSFIGNLTGTSGNLAGNPSISVSGIDLNITGNISRVNNITANSFIGNSTGTSRGLAGNPSISVSGIDLNNGDILRVNNITANSFIGNLTGNASRATNIDASGITNQNGMWTSQQRPGPTKLYRRDDNSTFSVQTYWTGSRWRLYGYQNDTIHADTHVGYADIAGKANSLETGKNCIFNSIKITGSGIETINSGVSIYYIGGPNNAGTGSVTSTGTVAFSCANVALFKGSIYVSSDNRIKNNIKNINSNSIDKILKLKPVSFNYIDIICNNKNNIGFIAQDVKEILPDAISYINDFIPNIYKVFDVKEDIITTNEDLTTLLKNEDIIQIINEKNNKEEFKIIEITSTYIKINKKYEYNKCFIYGKQINDYHTINYNYIYTLHISATQELYSKIQQHDKIIKEREIKLKEQQEKIDLLFELMAKK